VDPLGGKYRMHLVEIRRPAADLGAAMAQMRTWLDHRQTEPRLFELAFLPGPEIRLASVQGSG
jgi:hypothetical protein